MKRPKSMGDGLRNSKPSVISSSASLHSTKNQPSCNMDASTLQALRNPLPEPNGRYPMSPSDDGNPHISRPQRLMKRPKSMGDGLRNSNASVTSRSAFLHSTKNQPSPNTGTSTVQALRNRFNAVLHEATRPLAKNRPSSQIPEESAAYVTSILRVSSTKSQLSSSNTEVSMMQAFLNNLKTGLAKANGGPPENRPASEVSADRSSTASSFFRRHDDHFSDEPTHELNDKVLIDDSRLAEPATRLRDTISSIVSHYKTFRCSIMSSSDMNSNELLTAALKYHTVMARYLRLIDELPPCVRDTLDVKRLRQQLEQTISLLEPVPSGMKNEQAILLLDNTLLLVRSVLSDVQGLLLEHECSTASAVEEDERDTDSFSVEYDIITEPCLAALIDAPEEEFKAKLPQSDLRRIKSSMSVLNGGLAKKPSTASIYSYDNASVDNTTLIDRPEFSDALRMSRPLLAQHPGQSQETFVDYSQTIAAVSESLDTFTSVPLFAGSSQVSVGTPKDTTDVTYAQDGTPLAMSFSAIIEYLCREQSMAKIDKAGDSFIDIIFTNFRCWWTPFDLLRRLWQAYDDSYQGSRKLTIVLLVRRWVLSYWEPCDCTAISEMRKFLGAALLDGLVCSPIVIDILTHLQHYLDKGGSAVARAGISMEVEKMPFRLLDVARDMPLTRGDYGNVRLLEFNDRESCAELARQLTLKESDMYLQMSAAEVVDCFLHPGADPEAEKKLRNQRTFSSTLKRWTTHSVLKRNNPTKRARTFAFLARLAKVCISLRNYSSAHSIYNGLESVHLDSLVQTKEELTLKGRKTMQYLTQFFAEKSEISIQSSARPTVPVMATYAGKLQRLKEAKPSIYTASKVDGSVQLVNISLFRAATRIIYAMESNHLPYCFKVHIPVQGYLDYLLQLVPIDEDELHENFLSLKHAEQERKTRFFGRRKRTNSRVTLSKLGV